MTEGPQHAGVTPANGSIVRAKFPRGNMLPRQQKGPFLLPRQHLGTLPTFPTLYPRGTPPSRTPGVHWGWRAPQLTRSCRGSENGCFCCRGRTTAAPGSVTVAHSCCDGRNGCFRCRSSRLQHRHPAALLPRQQERQFSLPRQRVTAPCLLSPQYTQGAHPPPGPLEHIGAGERHS